MKEIYGDETLASVFPPFKNDKERIKYISRKFKKRSLIDAFNEIYGTSIDSKSITKMATPFYLEIGKIYTGTVKSFTKRFITFEIPGIKEDILCKENFVDCMPEVENFLLTHENKLMFEVREKTNNQFIVSVINAYYNAWVKEIEKGIKNRLGLEVHVDELVKGGYVCHTDIRPLVELTGRNYTHSVFVPGSQIVLNIERDFEKWLGQDIIVAPQNFVNFRKVGAQIEKSLVSSRKVILQIEGMKNMFDIYQSYLLAKNLDADWTANEFPGTVTGIINSSKKTGIFVELNDKYITGLMPITGSELLRYHPGDQITVRIKEFEIQEGREPFEINKKYSSITRCNVRPVFEIVK